MKAHDELALDSPALGTSLFDLVKRCGDRLRPQSPIHPAEEPAIALTFSGGGFRATFAALGVVRYLADAGLLKNVRYVSSVSGGSVANGMLAIAWPKLREHGYAAAAVDREVIEPLALKVISASLKSKLLANIWRAVGIRNRTDVLAWAFDDWFYGNAQLEALDPECRWIFNAANLTTGVRFAFERDVVGDYVTGLVPTAGTAIHVASAVAASAAVPGAFAPMKLRNLAFPCESRGLPALLDGGAYDNTGLEALDSNAYRDVFTISLNAGGVFVTGGYGKIPFVRELSRANGLLYRQSTALRSRWMIDRFQAWERTPNGENPPDSARRGVLFALATTISADRAPPQFQEFAARYPEYRSYDGDDLAFVPTVFDSLPRRLVERLIYRGWWLTGASLARWHPDLARISASVAPPPVS